MDIKKLNEELLRCLRESEDDIDISTYNFTFKVLDDDTIIVKGDEVNTELSCDTTDPEILHDDLEEQMDLVVSEDLMPDVNITGTEIVGYQYDEETKQGSFEFNIFYEEV